MTFGQRVEDRWKRDTFPFKTLFCLSRYDFRFPRYRRVKRKVIFNRLLPLSSSFTLARLTDPFQSPDKRQTQFLENRTHAFPGKNMDRGSYS